MSGRPETTQLHWFVHELEVLEAAEKPALFSLLLSFLHNTFFQGLWGGGISQSFWSPGIKQDKYPSHWLLSSLVWFCLKCVSGKSTQYTVSILHVFLSRLNYFINLWYAISLSRIIVHKLSKTIPLHFFILPGHWHHNLSPQIRVILYVYLCSQKTLKCCLLRVTNKIFLFHVGYEYDVNTWKQMLVRLMRAKRFKKR